MDNTLILIIGVFVVIFIVWCLSIQKDGYYYTQAYYPYSYTAGYGGDYPYYEKQGYKGPGSYGYPGYGPKYAKQMENECKLGCLGNVSYAELHQDSPDCKQCLRACAAKNPYSMGV